MSNISNSDLYYMLAEKGYRVDIKKENNSKRGAVLNTVLFLL